jgi:steroid delta-isomerase-like uncharacterized protein
MTSNVDVIRRLTDEVFVKGNLDAIDELVAEDMVDHDPPPGMPNGKEGQREIVKLLLGAHTEVRIESDEYLETTDGRVVQNWAMTAVHSGEFFGMPPSNQRVRLRGVEIWQVADGKVTARWGAVDMSDVAEKAMG